jgi:hypothetical protein
MRSAPSVPVRESWAYGEVVATPTRPFESIRKVVVVAEAVEVEIKNNGVLARERASIVKRPAGVVEAPIPRLPALEKSRAVEVAVPLVDVENER